MKETNNKRKEEILASAVRSFPIYEVQQICFESRRYPRRRIRLQRVGLFQTKESAEDAITLGEGDTHEHVLCFNVFCPTRPVPAKIATQLKEKLEEMKKTYGEL